MAKRRISLRVSDDEIAVVGTIDQWRHLILTYTMLAETEPEPQAWLDAAEWVKEWVEKGYARTEDEW